jgi:hypothetical protein
MSVDVPACITNNWLRVFDTLVAARLKEPLNEGSACAANIQHDVMILYAK